MVHQTINSMPVKLFLAGGIFLLSSGILKAQSLEDMLNQRLVREEEAEITLATFKSGRIINGHSIENTQRGDLIFLIGHRFGNLNSGFYNFFGLDNANTRLGLDYGITDRINAGFGRSTYQKTWDGFLKFRLLRQSTGKKSLPFSLSLVLASDINTLNDQASGHEYTLTNRLSYMSQVLVARKFGPRLSLQLSSSFIHKNLVTRRIDENNILAIGSGARFKLNNRLSLNAEYFYLLPGQTADDYRDSFSLGVDLETGGHVFQLHVTNARSLIGRGFITETSGNWLDGDLHFGFNIARVFGLGKRY